MDRPLYVDGITSFVDRDAHPERRAPLSRVSKASTPASAPDSFPSPTAPADQVRFDDAPLAHTSTATFDALLFVNRWADPDR